MPNKFQRSVQERQNTQVVRNAGAAAMEEERKAVPPPVSAPTEKAAAPSAAKSAVAAVIEGERKAALPPEPGRAEKAAVPPAVKPAVDIGEYLRPSPARLAKNKTFYLDEDVISALKAAAQSRQVTDSKLANDIMRTVLLGKK
ncbi:MAG: hypothetical protein FWE00_11585 [Defluviitaleaceae bacterium]|nr:hypothetical protein [Defluviitaleaceae bacterium]